MLYIYIYIYIYHLLHTITKYLLHWFQKRIRSSSYLIQSSYLSRNDIINLVRSGRICPKLSKTVNLSKIYHWSLNSIAAHNFIKVSLLITYNSIHKYDIICLSETYLDSSTVLGDDCLEIPGYNLVRCDYSTNTKRGGVCVYYKSYLLLKVLNMKHLQKCLNIEFYMGKKICRLLLLYRSPSQNQKMANVVPLFKKGEKQCVKNYRPLSFLPICSKYWKELYITMHTITLLITI